MNVCSCVCDRLLAWHHHCFTKVWLFLGCSEAPASTAWGDLGRCQQLQGPGGTSSLALSQEVGDKVGSDPPIKAVGEERVQYRPRAPCKNPLHCPASLGDFSWRGLGRGAGPPS